jgi:hypothetical protein
MAMMSCTGIHTSRQSLQLSAARTDPHIGNMQPSPCQQIPRLFMALRGTSSYSQGRCLATWIQSTPSYFTIHFNIILPSTFRSPKWPLPFRLCTSHISTTAVFGNRRMTGCSLPCNFLLPAAALGTLFWCCADRCERRQAMFRPY